MTAGSGAGARPSLAVIVASTRPGRAGGPIGEWVLSGVREHGGFEAVEVDLAVLALPLLDEPGHPRLGRYTKPHTHEWSALVGAADAFAFVVPEYNHGYPATLKNALDYLHAEWSYKPAGFVSYGGVAAGTRAVQQLKPVLVALRMFAVAESVNIPFHAERIDAKGVFTPTEQLRAALAAMLDELLRTEVALRPLRLA